jgi:hypothetical protein
MEKNFHGTPFVSGWLLKQWLNRLPVFSGAIDRTPRLVPVRAVYYGHVDANYCRSSLSLGILTGERRGLSRSHCTLPVMSSNGGSKALWAGFRAVEESDKPGPP